MKHILKLRVRDLIKRIRVALAKDTIDNLKAATQGSETMMHTIVRAALKDIVLNSNANGRHKKQTCLVEIETPYDVGKAYEDIHFMNSKMVMILLDRKVREILRYYNSGELKKYLESVELRWKHEANPF
jgi:hypothetical protein